MSADRPDMILIALALQLVLLLAYTGCGWLALSVVARMANTLVPPYRRIPTSGRITIIGPVVLFVLIGGWWHVARPPAWRSALYDETFDACRDGSMARVRIMLWLGASPDGLSDYEAGTPGMEFSSHVNVAAMKGNHGVLQYLLEKGANPNLGCSDMSPLITAVHNHDAESVKLLLAHGADPRFGYLQGNAADHALRMKFPDLAPVIRPYLNHEETQRLDGLGGVR